MPDDKKKLQALREQIDAIDDQMLALLNKRASHVLEIGHIKKRGDRQFLVLEREESIYQRLVALNQGPFPSSAIRPIFREIMSASLSLEKTLQIACLGPEATFSHIAAIQQFGQAVNFTFTRGVPDIFDEVERGRADYGVVPIENSTEGVVNLTLDMFIESPLQICSEVMLAISQCLLSTERKLDAIKVVYSHPQPIAQCYNWLAKHMPHADIKETFSTAIAAQMAKTEPGSAAIASEFAAKAHEVPILRQRIEDNAQNYTRFWIIGQQSPGRTGSDKTSIMFSIKDGVGALHEILKPFSTHAINMTKIESRPFRKKPWEYIFFIDIEGHQQDNPIRCAIDEVAASAQFMKVLGSYPRSDRMLP